MGDFSPNPGSRAGHGNGSSWWSRALDIAFGSTVGGVLVRKMFGWESLPVGSVNTVLTVGSLSNVGWASTATTGITQLTGDVTAGPGTGSKAATLATVNSSPGSYTNASLTVNSKGLVTAASSGAGLSVPQVTVYTSGTGTYTTPAGALYLRIRGVGGGGGGAAGDHTNGGTSGTAGGNTTFGTSLLTGNGGGAGATGAGLGIGGTASGGNILNVSGGYGNNQTSVPTSEPSGGIGGATLLGTGGAGGAPNGNPGSAGTGYGGGGGSGSTDPLGGGIGQAGGGGGSFEHILTSPGSTYSYAVGAGGSGGTGTTNGGSGGSGGSGCIIVEAHFQ